MPIMIDIAGHIEYDWKGHYPSYKITISPCTMFCPSNAQSFYTNMLKHELNYVLVSIYLMYSAIGLLPSYSLIMLNGGAQHISSYCCPKFIVGNLI